MAINQAMAQNLVSKIPKYNNASAYEWGGENSLVQLRDKVMGNAGPAPIGPGNPGSNISSLLGRVNTAPTLMAPNGWGNPVGPDASRLMILNPGAGAGGGNPLMLGGAGANPAMKAMYQNFLSPNQGQPLPYGTPEYVPQNRHGRGTGQQPAPGTGPINTTQPVPGSPGPINPQAFTDQVSQLVNKLFGANIGTDIFSSIFGDMTPDSFNQQLQMLYSPMLNGRSVLGMMGNLANNMPR